MVLNAGSTVYVDSVQGADGSSCGTTAGPGACRSLHGAATRVSPGDLVLLQPRPQAPYSCGAVFSVPVTIASALYDPHKVLTVSASAQSWQAEVDCGGTAERGLWLNLTSQSDTSHPVTVRGLFISGGGPAAPSSGVEGGGCMRIDEANHVEIEGCSLQGCASYGSGGGVLIHYAASASNATVTVRRSAVWNCTAGVAPIKAPFAAGGSVCVLVKGDATNVSVTMSGLNVYQTRTRALASSVAAQYPRGAVGGGVAVLVAGRWEHSTVDVSNCRFSECLALSASNEAFGGAVAVTVLGKSTEGVVRMHSGNVLEKCVAAASSSTTLGGGMSLHLRGVAAQTEVVVRDTLVRDCDSHAGVIAFGGGLGILHSNEAVETAVHLGRGVRLENCTARADGNVARGGGFVAMYNRGASGCTHILGNASAVEAPRLVVRNCTAYSRASWSFGGGVLVYFLSTSTGSHVRATAVDFAGNRVESVPVLAIGGGLGVFYTSTAQRCNISIGPQAVFQENEAVAHALYAYGGAVAVYAAGALQDAEVLLSDVLAERNRAAGGQIAAGGAFSLFVAQTCRSGSFNTSGLSALHNSATSASGTLAYGGALGLHFGGSLQQTVIDIGGTRTRTAVLSGNRAAVTNAGGSAYGGASALVMAGGVRDVLVDTEALRAVNNSCEVSSAASDTSNGLALGGGVAVVLAQSSGARADNFAFRTGRCAVVQNSSVHSVGSAYGGGISVYVGVPASNVSFATVGGSELCEGLVLSGNRARAVHGSAIGGGMAIYLEKDTNETEALLGNVQILSNLAESVYASVFGGGVAVYGRANGSDTHVTLGCGFIAEDNTARSIVLGHALGGGVLVHVDELATRLSVSVPCGARIERNRAESAGARLALGGGVALWLERGAANSSTAPGPAMVPLFDVRHITASQNVALARSANGTGRGGSIAVATQRSAVHAAVRVASCSVEQSVASTSGGAMYVNLPGALVRVEELVLVNNSAGVAGHAVEISSAESIAVMDAVVRGGYAGSSAPGVFGAALSLTAPVDVPLVIPNPKPIDEPQLQRQRAWKMRGEVHVRNVTVTDVASAGIRVNDGNVSVHGVVVSRTGGDCFIGSGSSRVLITDSSFSHCGGKDGTGVSFRSSASLSLIDVYVNESLVLLSAPSATAVLVLGSRFACAAGSNIANGSADIAEIVPDQPWAADHSECCRTISVRLSCSACPLGQYALEHGSTEGTANTTVRVQCLPCPVGAQCSGGDALHANPGFWGIASSRSGIFQTHLCPDGYCCESDSLCSLRACAERRTGVLCGTCAEGSSLAFGSSACVTDGDCGAPGVVFLFVCVLIGAALLFVVRARDYAEACASSVPQVGRDSACSPAASTEPPGRGSNSALCPVGDSGQADHTGRAGLSSVLFYFFQIAPLLVVPDGDSGLPWEVQLAALFNLEIPGREAENGKGSTDSVCIVPGTDAVGREVFRMVVPCAIIAVVWCLYQFSRLLSVRAPSVWRFEVATLSIVILGYKAVFSSTLALLHCETIDGSERLYIQADVECFTSWQICLFFVAATLYAFPFALVLWQWRRRHRRFRVKYLLGHLEAPFVPQRFYWRGATLFVRLLLVSIASFVVDRLDRLMVMCALLLVVLALEVVLSPYRSRHVQVYSLFAHCCLVFVAAINVRAASYLVQGSQSTSAESEASSRLAHLQAILFVLPLAVYAVWIGQRWHWSQIVRVLGNGTNLKEKRVMAEALPTGSPSVEMTVPELACKSSEE